MQNDSLGRSRFAINFIDVTYRQCVSLPGNDLLAVPIRQFGVWFFFFACYFWGALLFWLLPIVYHLSTCSLWVGQAWTGIRLGNAVNISEQHPDLPSSRPALTLEPGQLVIEYSGVGPNSGFRSSLFIPLPRRGYQSKQMCINKKLLTSIMEKTLVQTGKRADCLEVLECPLSLSAETFWVCSWIRVSVVKLNFNSICLLLISGREVQTKDKALWLFQQFGLQFWWGRREKRDELPFKKSFEVHHCGLSTL